MEVLASDEGTEADELAFVDKYDTVYIGRADGIFNTAADRR